MSGPSNPTKEEVDNDQPRDKEDVDDDQTDKEDVPMTNSTKMRTNTDKKRPKSDR